MEDYEYNEGIEQGRRDERNLNYGGREREREGGRDSARFSMAIDAFETQKTLSFKFWMGFLVWLKTCCHIFVDRT